MAVANTAVPPGTQHVVGLLLTNPITGDPSFLPGSIGEAATSSFSSQLPVYPTTLEGPTTNGNTTRFIASVNNSETQDIAFTGAGNGVGMLMTAAVNYAYDPSFTAFSNRQLRRGTGGDLDVANPLYAEGADVSDTGDRAGQDVRAFLYANDLATPVQAVRLAATAAGSLNVASIGAATIVTVADVATSAAAASIAAANTSRFQAIVTNLDATNNMRIGDTNITTTRGIRLGPGESATLETTAQIFAIAEAGTPSVSVTELEF